MKIAVVVQRYGKELVGGAESHARIIAHKLAENPDWQIHVYTTTARDYLSWKNYYPPGSSYDGKVRVFRFRPLMGRNRYLFAAYNNMVSTPLKLLASSKKTPRFLKRFGHFLETLWFILQGPYCPNLIRMLKCKKQEYHKIFFFTYLYYPTVFGVPSVKEKAVLIPTAHNENPLYFSLVRKVFEQSSYLLVNTRKEKELVNSISPELDDKITITGLGLKKQPARKSSQGHEDTHKPYLLFMGRMGKGKEVNILIEYFLSWNRKPKKNQLSLVLAGNLEQNLNIPDNQNISYLGVVSDKRKNQLLKNCFAIVNPSPHESLSMLVLEGIMAKKPVIINGKDPVLRSYSQQMKSVLSYFSENEFHKKIDYLYSDDWKKIEHSSLEHSEKWVCDNYSWEKVMEAYHKTIKKLPESKLNRQTTIC